MSQRVTVNGSTELKDLLDIRVDLAMSATGVCDIVLSASRTAADDSGMLPSGVAIGNTLKVEGSDPERPATWYKIFEGDIVAITVDVDVRLGDTVTIRAADESYKLWDGGPPRAILNKSYGDMITAMAQETGLRASVDASLSSGTIEHHVQTVSNGHHLREIMLRTGCYWQMVDGVLTVAPLKAPSTKVEVKYGEDLVRIKGRISGVGAAKKAEVRGWDPKTQQEIVSTKNDKALTSPGLVTDMASKIEGLASRGAPSYAWYAVGSVAEADKLATSLRAREVAERLQARIEVSLGANTSKLVPGNGVEVKGAGKALNGVYLIATVQHRFNAGGWSTVVTTGTAEPVLFGEFGTAAGQREMTWTRSGPVVGVVSNIGDDQHAGRVKVKLAMLSGTFETDWARVVSAGAGKSRGFQVMPQVNDEVLVVFEQGDPARPLVVGGLWSDKNPAPLAKPADYSASGQVTTWSLVSSNGERITISDAQDKDKKFIEIAMPGNKVHLHVGTEKVELWADDGKTLEVKSGKAKMLLDAQGDLHLEANNITIKAQQKVTVDAGTTLELSGKTGLKANSNATAELKGNGPVTVESSAVTTIKGSIVQIN